MLALLFLEVRSESDARIWVLNKTLSPPFQGPRGEQPAFLRGRTEGRRDSRRVLVCASSRGRGLPKDGRRGSRACG